MRIFYDVDTQHDFMDKKGALYVPDAELIKPNLRALTAFALQRKIPLVGSEDNHFGTLEYKEREGELQRWGGPFPDHCMNGTCGREKIAETSFLCKDRSPIYIEHKLDGTIDEEHIHHALIDMKNQTGNIIIEKQSYDVFTNPNAAEFLKRANVKEAVVYGVATDYCVKAAVLGMQNLGIQCYVIDDAIKGVFPQSTASALEEMTKAGAKFTTTEDVLGGRI